MHGLRHAYAREQYQEHIDSGMEQKQAVPRLRSCWVMGEMM